MKKSAAKKPKQRPRSAPATLQLRVQAVLTWRLEGAARWNVLANVAAAEEADEAPWTIDRGGNPLSERQIRRYMKAADKLIAEACDADRAESVILHLAQRQHLHKLAVGAGDLRTALAVLADMATLQGIYPAKKIEHSGKVETTPLTPDQQAELLAALLEKVDAQAEARNDSDGATPETENGGAAPDAADGEPVGPGGLPADPSQPGEPG